MTVVLLLIAAAALLGNGETVAAARAYLESSKLTRRQIAGGAAAVAALGLWWFGGSGGPPPTPVPPAPGQLDLRGLAVGPTAADDLAAFAGLCDELAAVLEHDGSLGAPRITSGLQIEDLRTAARDARMKGQSIGQRQPKLRAAIQQYLDATAGDDGGPLTAAGRSAWVAAFRDIARAAEAALR